MTNFRHFLRVLQIQIFDVIDYKLGTVGYYGSENPYGIES